MTTTARGHLPPLPSTIRTLLDHEAQALEKTAFTPQHCVTCRGAKTFRWLDSRQQQVEYDCACEDQYVLFRFLSHSGVKLSYQRLGWADLTYLSEEAANAVSGYHEYQQGYLNAGFGLVIHGDRGNGKTLLAHLLLKDLISDGMDVFATTFGDMIEAYVGGWRNEARERWFDATVRNAGVLFIDDVGREFKSNRFKDATLTEPEKTAAADNRPGSMKETLLEAVVRSRVANCQPTFITTNLTRDEIQSGYGGHLMSLLSERSVFIEVVGSDRRQEMNQREDDYVRQGLTRPIVLR